MHAAKLATSPRLQRVLAYLRGVGSRGATSMELATACQVVAPSTYISELRANGIAVDCVMEHVGKNGTRVYRFFLKGWTT